MQNRTQILLIGIIFLLAGFYFFLKLNEEMSDTPPPVNTSKIPAIPDPASMDFTDPDAPVDLSSPFNLLSVNLPGLNYTAIDAATDGEYLYIAGGPTGFHVFSLDDPVNPVWVNTLRTSGDPNTVQYRDGLVYVSEDPGGASLEIIDVTDPRKARIIRSGGNYYINGFALDDDFIYASHFNGLGLYNRDTLDVEAYVECGNVGPLAVSDGYACVPLINSMAIVKTEPIDSAEVVKKIEELWQCSDVAIKENYALVTSRGYTSENANPGLYAVNISTPENAEIANYLEATGCINRIHLIGNYAYLVTYGDGIHVVDISNLPSMELVTTIMTPGAPRNVCDYGNFAYIPVESGICVLDINNPGSPVIAGNISTPASASSVKIAHGYAYICGMTCGLQVLDIDPVEDTHVVASVPSEAGTYCVDIDGGYAFVANGSNNGLLIADIDPPGETHQVNFVELSEYTESVDVHDGYAFVTVSGSSDEWWQESQDSPTWVSALEIVDIDPVSLAHVVNSVPIPGEAEGVTIDGEYAYVCAQDAGLVIVDINPIGSAEIVKTLDTRILAENVRIADGYAYIAASNIYTNDSKFYIADIDPLETAEIVGAVSTPFSAHNLVLVDNYALIADYTHIQVFDISSPEEPVRMDAFETPGGCHDIAVDGDYIYVADGGGGFGIYTLY